MTRPIPAKPKIYHIVHIDRLSSIIKDGQLWCDAKMMKRGGAGTTIGISNIKQRRLKALSLVSHPGLRVGDCVPFYFCPRSVMLYVIHKGNHPELTYHGGQGPILHLEADLHETVAWADRNEQRWAFTTSNAGSFYFEDYSDLVQLDNLDWDAIQATDWRNRREGKQAEFLTEHSFPWELMLISRIGVLSRGIHDQVSGTVVYSSPGYRGQTGLALLTGRGNAMIEHKTGDIFAEDAEALVNSVNCVGILGRGIALQFKHMFPENFKAYADACKRNEVQSGQMFVFDTGQLTHPRYIINFSTKRHWRGKSRMEDIESGLKSLSKAIMEHSIRSIAIPPLGSDLGGLQWAEVRPRIEAMLRELDDIEAVIFEPGSAPADGRPNRSTNVPRMTPGRAALVSLMRHYLGGLLDPFVTLREVHKLMYFMQVAGEPLQLHFQKRPDGPYADNMRRVLKEVEGHLVSGYTDGGNTPDKPLALVPGAVEDADVYLAGRAETREHLARGTELVAGFESSFGLELLATVHWIATEHPFAAEDEVIGHAYAWDDRKRQFSARQIKLALQVIQEQAWLESGSPGQKGRIESAMTA